MMRYVLPSFLYFWGEVWEVVGDEEVDGIEGLRDGRERTRQQRMILVDRMHS
jgi:hypothetical protein